VRDRRRRERGRRGKEGVIYSRGRGEAGEGDRLNHDRNRCVVAVEESTARIGTLLTTWITRMWDTVHQGCKAARAVANRNLDKWS
jgi:hypothetical protein